MKTQTVAFKRNSRKHEFLAFICLLALLLLPACARQPQPAGIEEITFQSGSSNSSATSEHPPEPVLSR